MSESFLKPMWHREPGVSSPQVERPELPIGHSRVEKHPLQKLDIKRLAQDCFTTHFNSLEPNRNHLDSLSEVGI